MIDRIHRSIVLCCLFMYDGFCFQAEDGIRYLVRSRGLGDVYKRQGQERLSAQPHRQSGGHALPRRVARLRPGYGRAQSCLLYTSDAADERSSVDLGGRRILKKKKYEKTKKIK